MIHFRSGTQIGTQVEFFTRDGTRSSPHTYVLCGNDTHPFLFQRNKKQLKKLWENMKMDQKRMAKRVQLLTGRDPDTDRASKELSYMTDTGPYSVESEHENPSNEFSAEDLEEKPEPVFMHGVNWNHFQSTGKEDCFSSLCTCPQTVDRPSIDFD
jgi:hypothetical protein